MSELRESIACCGIMELHGVSGRTPEEILNRAFSEEYWDEPAYVFFSDLNKDKTVGRGGWGLAAFITAKKLGPVKCVSPAKGIRNDNTGNMLTMWVWTPNYPKLLKSLPCSRCGK